MNTENTCYRLKASALVSAAILSAVSGPAFAREARGAHRPANEITAKYDSRLAEYRLGTSHFDRRSDPSSGETNTAPSSICIDDAGGYRFDASRPPTGSTTPCSPRLPGFRLAEKFALKVAASGELQGKICQASIQDQIEWDYEGNRRWAAANLESICKNAKYSLQPGVCFNRIMHGNISHGEGTRWHWRPALKLCAGTRDANATIKCFSDAIGEQIAWPEAIEQCRARP